jgi:hypothetical protein
MRDLTQLDKNNNLRSVEYYLFILLSLLGRFLGTNTRTKTIRLFQIDPNNKLIPKFFWLMIARSVTVQQSILFTLFLRF